MSTTSDSFFCDGCSRYFNRIADLRQHWGRTQKSRCHSAQQWYHDQLRRGATYAPRRAVSGSRHPSPSFHRQPSSPASDGLGNPWEEAQNEDDVPAFAGDFFGQDYDEQDFPGLDSDQPLTDDDPPPTVEPDESNSDNDDDNVTLEPQWEPPRRTHNPHHHDAQSSDQVENDPDNDPDRMDEDRRSPFGLSSQTEVHIEHFPGLAGAPVDNSESSESAYVKYMTDVNGNSNPWAPFTSEIEWEVAKWAKLRGPGSTAFSDLLAIPGVGPSLYQWCLNSRV